MPSPDAEFVRELKKLLPVPAMEERATLKGKVLIVPEGWSQQNCKPPAAVPHFSLSTLAGVIDLLDDLAQYEVDAVQIAWNQVVLFGPVDTAFNTRPIHAMVAPGCAEPTFGRFMSQVEFLIHLQTQFVQDVASVSLQTFVGTVTNESLAVSKDDGITQTMSTRKGLTLSAEQKLPNPVTLRPFRTFLEVEQPASSFILRARKGADGDPQFALFEADGGAWKIAATLAVRAWIEGQRVDTSTVLLLA